MDTKLRAAALAGGLLLAAALPAAALAQGRPPPGGPVATDLECTDCVGTDEIAAGAVTADKLAPGAIPPVTADDVFVSTVLVSPAGTAAESGQALLDALASTTDASADNPYLIKLEPGVYDVGSTSVGMIPFVDIEGSGQGITVVRSAASTPVVHAATAGAPAELRHLTLAKADTGPGGTVVPGVRVQDDVALDLLGVTVESRPESLRLTLSSPDLAAAPDVRVRQSTLDGQVVLEAGDLEVLVSVLTAGVSVEGVALGTAASFSAATSQIVGFVSVGAGASARCVYSYDENFAELGPDCL